MMRLYDVVYGLSLFTFICGQNRTAKIALLYTNESNHSPLSFQQAVSEINNNADLLAEVTLEYVTVNIGSDSDNPAAATYQMCRMLKEEEVVAVVGPFTSAQIKSCSYIAGQVGLPIVAPTATDPNLNNPHWASTLALLSPSNKKQAEALIDMIEFFEWRRVSVIYTNDPYGVTLTEAVKEEIINRKMELITEVEIDYEVASQTDQNTSRSWIAQLLNTSTRVALLLTQPDYGDLILRTAAEMEMVGEDFAWVAATAISEAMLFAYDDTGRMKDYYDGVVGLSPYLDVTGGYYRRLQDVYKENGYNVLTPTDALVYDAVYLISYSIDKVYKKDPDLIVNFPGQCYQENPQNDWRLGAEMFTVFTTSKYTGITGHRQMWPDGQPDPETLRYNIVNYKKDTNKVSRMGYWEPKNRDRVSMLEAPQWYGGSSSLPTDDPTLSNSSLKLGVLEDKPFIIYNYTLQGFEKCSDMPNKDWCYSGVSIEIIRRLQRRLKFDYEFVESPDGLFGSEVHGVWNGLINEINQQRMDIGVVGFGTSHSRERAVDFGISFLPGGVRMATKKDITTTDYFFFLKPFSHGVWLSILLGMLFFFIVIFLLDKYSPYGHAGGIQFKCKLCQCEQCTKLLSRGFNFKDNVCPFVEDHALKHQMGIMSFPNAFWLSICSFLTYAPADGIPKNWSGRIMISVWWMICLVLVSMYTANLAAFLTVSRMEVNINDVDDLLTQKEYLFGTVSGTVTENLLRHSDSFKLQKVFQKSNQSKSFDDGVDRMRHKNYIFMYGTGPLEYTSSTEHCDIELIGEVLIHFGYAFAFQINSPYLDRFNREMLIMQEKGIIKDLWNQFNEGKCAEDGEFDFEADSLNIWSLLGLLVISLPMVVLGFLVFGLELFASPKGRGGKRMKTADVVKATFDMSPFLAEDINLDEESVGLTTTMTSPHVTMGYDDGL